MSNMVVNTNVLALNSHRNLKTVGVKQAQASARLSSGLRVNSAADDAAGLAISEKMRAQIRGLDQASKNAQDGVSLVQTAEGGMQEIDNMIQRIRELVVQASNDTNENNTTGTGDRQKIQDEIDQLIEEIDSMAERVEFNKKKVINGTYQDTGALKKMAADRYNAVLEIQASTASEKADAITGRNTAKTLLETFETTYVNYTGYVSAKQDYDDDKSAFDTAWEAITDADKTALKNAVYTNPALKPTDNDLKDASSFGAWYSALDAQGKTDAAAGFAGVTALGTAYDTMAASLATFKTAADTWNADVNGQAQLKQLKSDLALAESKLKSATKKDDIATQNLNDATAFKNSADAITAVNNPLYFQVGANANQGIDLYIGSVKTDVLGIGDGFGNATISVMEDTGADITSVIEKLDNALSYVTTQRSKLGAVQNRLDYTQKSLDISSENLSASESRIRDTDMAKEMMKLTQANVLQQAATSMLAQANQAPQSVLQLLQ